MMGMKLTFAVLLIGCLLLPPLWSRAQSQRGQDVRVKGENGQEIDLYAESHALVIGVSDYPVANGWRRLPGVKTDVEQVSEALRKQGFNIRTKINPTQEELDKALRDFIGDYGVNQRNRLLIWFAGHGHTENLSDGREQGYIVPLDTPDPSRDLPGFRRRAISMSHMEAYASLIESKHVLFVFDSCFSGAIFDVRSGNTVPPEIESKIAGPVRLFIASGTKEQKVPDDSVFRTYFVRALEGEADLNSDGYVVGEELGIYLSGRVASVSRESQTPRYGRIKDARLNIGDFVFVLPRRSGTASSPAGSMTSDPTLQGEQAYWNEIVGSNDPADFEAFLNAHPKGVYANAARARLKKLTAKSEEPPKTGGTTSAAALLLQAENALKRGDSDEAFRVAEEALKIEPQNAVAHRLKGQACLSRRDLTCRDKEAEVVIQSLPAPRNAREYEARAWANAARRNQDQALADVNEAIRLDSNFGRAYYHRGNVFRGKGETDAAIADYSRAISLEPNGTIYYRARASAYSFAKHHDLAIADYSKAISLNPNDIGMWRGRAAVYQAKGDYPRAVEDLTRTIGLDPNSSSHYFARGNVRRDQGQTDLAIRDYSKSIELNSSFGPAYAERAKLYRLTGRNDLAEADEKKAAENPLRRVPVSATAAWIAQAEDGLRNRRYDEVWRIIEEQLAKEPQNAVAHRLKSDAARFLRKDSKAWSSGIQTVLQLLTGKTLRDAREYEARAWALLMSKGRGAVPDAEYDLIIADCNEAIRLDPRFDRAYLLRGSTWWRRSMYERAISDYTRAIELYPDNVTARRARASLYAVKKDYDAAIADISIAIRSDAASYDYLRRGDFYAEKKDYRSAITDYTSAIKLHADYWPAYEKRAQAYRSLGLGAQAEADEKKVRELKKQ